ncbi:hypothetical protein M3936_07795 [Sutcliffiella horikoshii]|uniref:hypothetical protein n=1 Tax=Sutcliffiella horikoshii TaxID=79883 RepID=UPI002042631C|nr:hypothetical protein [Sutcliffiella horikoshii]MCM3617478.1 hypothetical protein [Sutcliffiella horikoshii]
MENELLKQILQGINEMKLDISDLKSDVSVLKSDVSVLKSDVNVLKSDVSTLKSDVSTLKNDVESIKVEFKQYKDEYRRDMKKIDLRLNATNERLDSFKFDTDLLIEKNAKMEFRINRLEKSTEI